jgi:hypothetical protein
MTERVANPYPGRGWAWKTLLFFLLSLLLGQPALAHLTPNSEIRLRFEPGAVRADVLIPLAEYAYATGGDAQDGDALAAYLTSHTRAATRDRRPWTTMVGATRIEPAPGGPDIRAIVTYIPPPGASDRRLLLRWDAVIREADSHFALVMVQGDLARGLGQGNDLIGTFTAGQPTLVIDRGDAGHGALFTGALRLGGSHILEGHDHLLFLLALLLPAPLFASGGRWGAPRPPRQMLRRLAWVVTAFTLGHSVTLIAAAAFDAHLPARPVEAAIALSVLVSAIHAMRPLVPGREPWIAFGFGLVHGLAFATVITGFGVGAGARATAILGFNLGIEAVQLVLVVLLLPALLLGARWSGYPGVRLGLGAFATVAALTWLVERVSGLSTPVGEGLAAVLPTAGLALIAISLLAGAAWLVHRRFPVAAATNRA